jgi:hypothetical protein
MQLAKARKRLATLWFILSALIFTIFIFVTNVQVLPAGESDAWGWFLPTILPSLTLMLSVFVAQTLGGDDDEKVIDGFVFKLAFCVSLFYLLILLYVLLSYSRQEDGDLLSYYKKYNTMLAALQSFVSACLGIFFTNHRTAAAADGK